MDFVRFGMSGASPRFRSGPVLVRAEQFAEEVKGREHHAEWFKAINHPDAQLIAAAPDLLGVLKALVGRVDPETSNAIIFTAADLAEARAAIAKAEGGVR